MVFSPADATVPVAVNVRVGVDSLSVDLSDGRSIAAPLSWYPRLASATSGERDNWRLIGGGEGIHWPDLDEDISVRSLLAGKPSAESRESLQRWLATRHS
jgi:hypothetical protein